MSAVDRLARRWVSAAAKRWPDDLADIMAQEWHAELDALRDDPAIGPATRTWRSTTFAASLALSPAVEAADAAPRTWRDRSATPVRALAATAGVTLLAAALSNGIRMANHDTWLPLGVRIPISLGLIAVAAALMAWLGAAAARRSRATTIQWIAGLGIGLFAFLMAGNRVAVMPFMGWIDILPAVMAWVVVTGLTVRLADRATSRRRHRTAGLLGGGLLALEAAAIGGSVHAADVLGIGLGSAPAWFPLALLPGGTADFGPFAADGTSSFGGIRETGPSFHAADILLGNVSAMLGPMALCAAFVIAHALRGARREAPRREPARNAVPIGIGAALLSLTALNLLRPFAPDGGDPHPTEVLARLADNSNVFGFGFAAHPSGRIALALIIGLLISQADRVPEGQPTPYVE